MGLDGDNIAFRKATLLHLAKIPHGPVPDTDRPIRDNALISIE